MSLTGYDVQSFGALEQAAFCAAMADVLHVGAPAVTIASVTDGQRRRRRRRALLSAPGASRISVAFVVAAATPAAAASLQGGIATLSATTFVATLRSAGLADVSSVSLIAAPEIVYAPGAAPAPPPSLPAAATSAARGGSAAAAQETAVIAGAAGGGGGGGLLLLGGGTWLLLRRRRLRQSRAHASSLGNGFLVDATKLGDADRRRLQEENGGGAVGAVRKPPPRMPLPPRFRYDVFLSYRRDDCAMVDLIEDKLCHWECNMRVFRDVRGHMAGTDFDVELLRCMMRSAVIVPVITLGAMRRLVTLDAERIDVTFAEYCFALHLVRRRCCVRCLRVGACASPPAACACPSFAAHTQHDRGVLAGLYPLVVGEECVEPKSRKTLLSNLFHDDAFKTLRDALPRTAPTASWRFVARTLAALGETLAPGWDAMSVHDVMCGSARMAGASTPVLPTSGMFVKDCYFLEGDKDKLRLCLQREFAEKVRRRIGVTAAAEEQLLQPAPAGGMWSWRPAAMLRRSAAPHSRVDALTCVAADADATVASDSSGEQQSSGDGGKCSPPPADSAKRDCGDQLADTLHD